MKHIELWYFAREAPKLVKASTEAVLFLAQDKEAVAVEDGVEDSGELLGEPEAALGPDLDLGEHGVLVQTREHDAGVKPAAVLMN